MSKCEKHNCFYKTKQMEQGKTMYFCPECEKEQVDKIKNMFGFADEQTKNFNLTKNEQKNG